MKKLNKLSVVFLLALVMGLQCGCQEKGVDQSGNTQSLSDSHTNETPSSSTKTSVSTPGASKTDASKSDSPYADIPQAVIEAQNNNSRNHWEKEKKLRKDDTVAATVNGTSIYQADIQVKMSANSLNRENFRIQLESMDLTKDEKEKQWKEYASEDLPDEKAVLNELIRETLIQKEAARLNLFPTDEKALVYAKEQYALMKEVPRLYEAARIYQEIMGISNDEYIHQIADEYKQEMGRSNLYDQITKDSKDKTEKDTAFEKAIDEWEDQANIVYNHK